MSLSVEPKAARRAGTDPLQQALAAYTEHVGILPVCKEDLDLLEFHIVFGRLIERTIAHDRP